MDNNSTYDYVPVLSGLSIIQTEFGDTPDEDDYLENAFNCLRLIKNVHIEMYGITGVTDEKGEICLPTNALSIEAVTSGATDWFTVNPFSSTSRLHTSGGYVPYQFTGDVVTTQFPNTQVSILYCAQKQDEEGLPLVTPQEARACAMWWVYVDAKRGARKGNNAKATYLQQATFDKNKAINQARLPAKLTQNLMNQLGILYSHEIENSTTKATNQ